MQIKCPQHRLPLEIEERTLVALGTSYSTTIGKCPMCRNLYINRMIFPACSTFQVAGQSYQFSDELHSIYPAKEIPAIKNEPHNKPEKKAEITPPMSKKERKAARRAEELQKKKLKEAERKQKAREAGIREMRERILGGTYTEYRVKTVHFVKEVPKVCSRDGDELVDVKRTSFEMYGVKVKAHARCCIRCNSAYLHEKKRTEIQEKVEALNKKPTISPKPSAQNQPVAASPLVISHVLQRIPVLESNDTQCPFCKNGFDTTVNLKYNSIDFSGQAIKKRATLQGCRHCKAVFADKEQVYAIRSDNFKKNVHTISPLSYQSAEVMMAATKLTPQQEAEANKRLPFEDLPGGVENISRESKVVQVYANKCHCQKCENKYMRVTTVNRTAVADTIDGSTANINVMFCKGCGQYFVSIVTLEQYKSIYGGLLMECKLSHDFTPSQYSWFDFAPDSILSRCGYTVKEGVSREYRQAILRYILETGKAQKYEIVEKINSFIFFRENQPRYEGACQRWREDIKYVNEYMIHRQKKVYGLEFKPAGAIKKK